jgi:GT2 family glycosyltransferase
MKLSVVIPYYESSPEKKEVLAKTLASFDGVDELIVVSENFNNLSRKRNYGGMLTHGDYILWCSDDVELIRGHLHELCVPSAVCTPYVNGRSEKLFHGHMWCMDRATWAKVGMMWEGYDGWYYDDSDYWMQIEKSGVPIKQLHTVNIAHEHPGMTLHTFNNNERESKNRNTFLNRWGQDALDRVTRII